jgi:hypothetical protein
VARVRGASHRAQVARSTREGDHMYIGIGTLLVIVIILLLILLL